MGIKIRYCQFIYLKSEICIYTIVTMHHRTINNQCNMWSFQGIIPSVLITLLHMYQISAFFSVYSNSGLGFHIEKLRLMILAKV